jgi:hypothetical protein
MRCMHMHVNLSTLPGFHIHTIVSAEGSVSLARHHNVNFSACILRRQSRLSVSVVVVLSPKGSFFSSTVH